MRRFLLLALALSMSTSAVARTPVAFIHDRAYWRAVIAQQYQVPVNMDAAGLAMELASLVSATDPEWRDTFGYEILANWIHRSGKLSIYDLDTLRKSFVAHAMTNLGESGTDSVFTRSFALLNLKELAAADLKTPFLTQASFDGLFDLAEKSLADEKDLRGFVPDKGWAHATAHGADLLRILARNSKLSVAQQSRLIVSVATRARTAATVFAWAEDARLAAALASVAHRGNLDATAFDAWFAALLAEHRQLWTGAFETSAYVRVRMQVNILAHLAALAARQPTFPVKLREALQATLAKVT
ncbi:MAG: DUF2785 domain-containing protein [Burkholderiales bacterium]|nr:DUF2785 domain-containing protein [Burkholderiales bacterium]